MPKTPKNLTLHPRVLELAELLMELLGYESLSAFIENLIRADYERRFPDLPGALSSPGTGAAPPDTVDSVTAAAVRLAGERPRRGKRKR